VVGGVAYGLAVLAVATMDLAMGQLMLVVGV
jgi:hypothetical protein